MNPEFFKNSPRLRAVCAVAASVVGFSLGWFFSDAILKALTFGGVLLVMLTVAVLYQFSLHPLLLSLALVAVGCVAGCLAFARQRSATTTVEPGSKSAVRVALFASLKAMLKAFVVIVVGIIVWVVISPMGKFPGFH